MKEIVFRGKSRNDGKWYEGDLGTVAHKRFIDDGKNNERVIPETVGQFIGVCDRNGAKIFEGDIVSYRGEHAVIVYDEETARFCLSFDTWSTDFDHLYGKDVEVIGNAYDNPELREGDA